MKFTEHLGAHLTPEWRSQYIQYEELKKILYDADEHAPPKDGVNEEILRRHYAKYEEGFFVFCDKELSKVSTFFAEKLAEATRRFHDLETEIGTTSQVKDSTEQDIERGANVNTNVGEDGTTLITKIKSKKQKSRGAKKLKELKFAVSEFYLSLILIQNFQELNFTGFRKILKKHDKMFQTESGVQYRKEKVETAPFFTNKLVAELILETEGIFINELEGGDRGKAMKRLRVPPLGEKQTNYSAFFWGLFSGIFFVLLVVVIITAYYKRPKKNWQPALRMYRGWFLIVTMIGLLGINIYGWSKAGVNHILIFELNPRDHLTFIDLLKVASLFGSLLCLSALAFLFSADFHLPQFAQPLVLTGFIILFLLNPTKTFHYTARFWFIKVMIRIIGAPLFQVRFADFWLADQLNSMVVPLLDFQYMICFYAYDWHRPDAEWQCTNPQNVVRPLVAILPAWWRLAQCLRRYKDTRDAWPHLVNAGKYSTSIFVTIFSTIAAIHKAKTGENQSGALFYVWIGSLIFSTFYTLFWDIRMDWGLLDKNAGDNFLLREQIVYDSKIFYYLAAFADMIFRFMWTLTVSVGEAGFITSELFVLFIATCEVFRRFVWNFFRLENEHLNNCGHFRAVRDISVKPVETDIKDELTIEQWMDHEHGPLPKRLLVNLLLNDAKQPSEGEACSSNMQEER
ncbi:solute carrier family 53 member 1-like [Rhopilema esculentum]|uniref:solute carrier family 53 member 1-like n=1 Tax=Rhopilema esculentum TaxID=499914 RepID=UPI0031E10A25|eukprot:gene10990-19829_t